MDQPDLNLEYNTNDELSEEFDYLLVMCYMMMLATGSSWDLFNTNKLQEGGTQFVNPNVGVRDVLRNTQYLPPLFKQFFNFSLVEFEELCCLVIPIINECRA